MSTQEFAVNAETFQQIVSKHRLAALSSKRHAATAVATASARAKQANGMAIVKRINTQRNVLLSSSLKRGKGYIPQFFTVMLCLR